MICKKNTCRKFVNSSVNGALYCEKHGCAFCYKHRGKQKLSDGAKVCEIFRDEKGRRCGERYADKEHNKSVYKDERKKGDKAQEDLNTELKNEIGRVSDDFWKKMENTLSQIALIKTFFIIDPKHEISNFVEHVKTLISNCSSLSEDDKTKWKTIYRKHFIDGSSSDYRNSENKTDFWCLVHNIYPKEKELLLELAQKHQAELDRQQEERENEKRNLLIQEIENELVNSPVVDISEVPDQFHNYKNFSLAELETNRDSIIDAIKNARANKELLGLLNRAKDSSDADLWSFIKSFEELKEDSASLAQKNAYQTYQSQVEAILNQLRERWNKLSEEQRLTSYWNNAAFKFINWLKEAENLQLATDDPFANFILDIKKQRTVSDIDNETSAAREHILAKFKQAVKNSLGTEQKTNEYQQIDQASDFEAVKWVRNNIKLSRVNHHSPLSPEKTPSPSENPPIPTPDQKEDNQSPDKKDDLPSDLYSLDLNTLKQRIKAKIKGLLERSGVKITSETYRDLCHGKQCWKQHLRDNLSSKEEVINFGQEMEKLISDLSSQEKKNYLNENSASKNNLFSFSNIFICLTVVMVLSLGIVVIIAKKKKKTFL